MEVEPFINLELFQYLNFVKKETITCKLLRPHGLHYAVLTSDWGPQ